MKLFLLAYFGLLLVDHVTLKLLLLFILAFLLCFDPLDFNPQFSLFGHLLLLFEVYAF